MTRINLVDLLVRERLVSGRTEARRLIVQGGVYINLRRTTSFWVTVDPALTPALEIRTGNRQATLLLSDVRV